MSFDFSTHNAENLEIQNETFLLYAPPGMGKTSTIKYLPGKTLLIDVDRTSHVLKGCPNIEIMYADNKRTWDWYTAFCKHAETNLKGKFDNIVIDNVSELERCMLSSLGDKGKNNGVPSQGDYQYMQFRVVNSFRWFKSLAKRTIFLAWETTELITTSEGQQFNRALPQINGKIVNNVLGLCHVVGRLMAKADGERGFVLSASNSIYAKNQLDNRKGCLQSEIFNIGDIDDSSSDISGD